MHDAATSLGSADPIFKFWLDKFVRQSDDSLRDVIAWYRDSSLSASDRRLDTFNPDIALLCPRSVSNCETELLYSPNICGENQSVSTVLMRSKFTLRVIRRALSDLNQQGLLQTASALTLGTLVALVPTFAVFFSIVQVLVPEDAIALRLQQWLLNTFLADNVQELSVYLEQFLSQTTRGALGLVSLGILLPTILSLVLSIEKAVNKLWRARKSRSLVRRVMTFYAVLSLTPACVVLAMIFGQRINIETNTQIWGVGTESVFSFLLIVVGLFSMYKLLPHRSVQVRPAFISAVCVAVLFVFLRLAFGLYVGVFASSSLVGKIYGALAILPVLCLWIYLIWILVLVGVAACVYFQYPRLLDDRHMDDAHLRARFTLNPAARWTILVLSYVAHHFKEVGGPMTITDIAEQLKLTVFDVEDVIEPSVSVGWLVYVEQSDGDAVLPARPLDQLSFADMFDLKHTLTLSISERDAPQALKNLWTRLDEIDAKGGALLSGITIGEFTELRMPTKIDLAKVSDAQ